VIENPGLTSNGRSTMLPTREHLFAPQVKDLRTPPPPAEEPAVSALLLTPAPARRPVVVRWDRVAVLVAVLLAAVLAVGAWGTGRSSARTSPAPQAVVVVQPGDTLWSLARQHAPADVATLEYVAAVERLNGVRAGALVPGTPLRLPAADGVR
jgi:Tfp pilus assembly protein FimV